LAGQTIPDRGRDLEIRKKEIEKAVGRQESLREEKGESQRGKARGE
jgi:hypothetical protein